MQQVQEVQEAAGAIFYTGIPLAGVGITGQGSPSAGRAPRMRPACCRRKTLPAAGTGDSYWSVIDVVATVPFDLNTRLRELNRLRVDGFLSDEEFQSEKRKLLNRSCAGIFAHASHDPASRWGS